MIIPFKTLAAVAFAGFLAHSVAAENPAQPPKPDSKPVKVYILSGQSNMVGIGQVTSGSTRWGDEFLNPVLSVYEGAYDAKADYDALKPAKTLALESFGGTKPTEYLKGGTQVVRGFFQPKNAAEFKGNVKSVDTRDFWPDVAKSPKNQGFHYHQNAGAYMQIGEAMGKGMLELLKGK